MSQNANSAHASAAGPPESTSTGLLERVRAREPAAWARLVELYGPPVYDWCRQSGLATHDAADVVQEVFAAVAVGVGDFRGGRRGSFRAWLRTITRNKVLDFLRRRQAQARAAGGTDAARQLREIPEPQEPSDPLSSAPAENALWHRALELVRAEFEDRTWQAFLRVTVDGIPPANVADEMGMSLDAVYQAKSRVLRRLRRELADLEADDLPA